MHSLNAIFQTKFGKHFTELELTYCHQTRVATAQR